MAIISGTQLYFNRPSIYASQWPTAFAAQFSQMSLVVANKSLPTNATQYSSVQNIVSNGGRTFISFAKNSKWGLGMDEVFLRF
jgi:hypothetical protein